MLFSAKLRLPASVSDQVTRDFVDEIMDVVELTPLRNALVGLPGLHSAPALDTTLEKSRCTVCISAESKNFVGW